MWSKLNWNWSNWSKSNFVCFSVYSTFFPFLPFLKYSILCGDIRCKIDLNLSLRNHYNFYNLFSCLPTSTFNSIKTDIRKIVNFIKLLLLLIEKYLFITIKVYDTTAVPNVFQNKKKNSNERFKNTVFQNFSTPGPN